MSFENPVSCDFLAAANFVDILRFAFTALFAAFLLSFVLSFLINHASLSLLLSFSILKRTISSFSDRTS